MTTELCPLRHFDHEGAPSERPRRATHGRLCIGHFHSLEQQINELPALISEVEKVLAKATSSTGPKISGTPERALPFDEKAGQALRDARDKLASWCDNIAETGAFTKPIFEINAMARFHARHLDLTVQQDWITDYADEIRQVRRGLIARTHITRTRRVEIGTCDGHTACILTTHELIACTGILRAETTTATDLMPDITCPVCGARYAPADWRPLSRRLHGEQDPYLTAAQLSQVFGGDVPVRTLQRWANDDDWRRHDDVTENGRRARYHLDDAQQSYTARRA